MNDEDRLDRLCDELRSRMTPLADPATEMARLRNSGHGIVESIYVIWKVFEIPLREAKTLAGIWQSSEQVAQSEALPDGVEKDVHG